MVHNAELAEELTQETYQRAINRVDGLRDERAALAWLYRIATNVALDHLQRARRPVVRLDDETRGEAEAASTGAVERLSLIEAAFERTEMSECVQSYLAGLPDGYRAVLLLHDGLGISNQEVADLLGCTLATVKIRIHRARKQLRALFEAGCVLGVDEGGVLVCDQPPTAFERAASSRTSRAADHERPRD